MTPVQWLICGVAALGFAFDLYETLVLPLIVRPALATLGNIKPGSPESNLWVGLLFYLPLASGGFFGLFGGYLTDLLGRRRVLVSAIDLLNHPVQRLVSRLRGEQVQLTALRRNPTRPGNPAKSWPAPEPVPFDSTPRYIVCADLYS